MRFPLSTPPAKPQPTVKPTNWWRTIPGQLAILAMLAGLVVILLGVMGVIGPNSL